MLGSFVFSTSLDLTHMRACLMQKWESDIAPRGSNFSIIQSILYVRHIFQKHSLYHAAHLFKSIYWLPLPPWLSPHSSASEFFHQCFLCLTKFFIISIHFLVHNSVVSHSSEPWTHGFGQVHLLPVLPTSSAHSYTHSKFSPCASFIILGTQMNTSFAA